jgi:predicted transposase YdaD
MRTDTFFYQIFLTFPHLIFELLNQPPLDGYQFSSREIKELARRFDGIYFPPENEIEAMFTVESEF